MTEQELQAYIAAIRPADEAAMTAARRRQAELAKPPGSLGKLEDMAVRMAGVTGQVCPEVKKCRVAVFAADNGVVAEGVSCAPQSVTVQQAVNMTRRKTGMSALAQTFGDDVTVYDVGIAVDVPCPAVVNRKVRYGTANMAAEPAMTRAEALQALAVGMEAAAQAKADGISVLGIGEMGIGNTTTSAAVLSVLLDAAVETVTGRGGGLTDEGFDRKKQVLRRALALHRPDKNDVLDVLHKVGGLDIAAMTGAFLGCAHEGIAAAVDGYISVVAALCAVHLCPAAADYLFLSHQSYELGYARAAQALGLTPCAGHASGGGQRMSPAVPGAGGCLRRNEEHGHLRRGRHSGRLSGAHPLRRQLYGGKIMRILLIGGSKSGKSTAAQRLCRRLAAGPSTTGPP